MGRPCKNGLICRGFGVAQHVAVFAGFFDENPRHAWGSLWTGLAPLLRNGGYEGERHMRENFSTRTLRTDTALLAVAVLAPIAGCGKSNPDNLQGVNAIVFPVSYTHLTLPTSDLV